MLLTDYLQDAALKFAWGESLHSNVAKELDVRSEEAKRGDPALSFYEMVDGLKFTVRTADELTTPFSNTVGLLRSSFRSMEALVIAVLHGGVHAAGERHARGTTPNPYHDILHKRHLDFIHRHDLLR